MHQRRPSALVPLIHIAARSQCQSNCIDPVLLVSNCMTLVNGLNHRRALLLCKGQRGAKKQCSRPPQLVEDVRHAFLPNDGRVSVFDSKSGEKVPGAQHSRKIK